ncbi:MAG: hypothetical protein OES34_06700 [Nitrosopumilus sp.]|nr:hypothetical protein [Nitrosopumilus sp.]
MGTLYCLKCKQTVEADTFAEADSLIDHGAKSIKCSADKSYIRWNGEAIVGTVDLIPTKAKAKPVAVTVTAKPTSGKYKKK